MEFYGALISNGSEQQIKWECNPKKDLKYTFSE